MARGRGRPAIGGVAVTAIVAAPTLARIERALARLQETGIETSRSAFVRRLLDLGLRAVEAGGVGLPPGWAASPGTTLTEADRMRAVIDAMERAEAAARRRRAGKKPTARAPRRKKP